MSEESTTETTNVNEKAPKRTEAEEEAHRRVRASQQLARVILGDGMADLAKTCRAVVRAHGENAEGAVVELLAALKAIVNAS